MHSILKKIIARPEKRMGFPKQGDPHDGFEVTATDTGSLDLAVLITPGSRLTNALPDVTSHQNRWKPGWLTDTSAMPTCY